MANVLGELFQDIADAIRSKTGSTDTLKPNQFSSAIESITTGGGSSGDSRVKYVTFMYGETELIKYPVISGDTCHDPVANGYISAPTKESTVQYNYTFYGWGASDGGAADANILKNITEDKTVYAIFTATARLYTITWLDDDGSVLTTTQVAYGSVPSYTPTKTDWVFAGWIPTPTAVTGAASYTATWSDILASGEINSGNGAVWSLSSTGILTVTGNGTMPGWGSADSWEWHNYRSSIKHVKIGAGINFVGHYAFCDCTNLESVEISNGAAQYGIGKYAFSGDKKLVSIIIPQNITTIYCYAFHNCTALASVVFEAPEGWGITANLGGATTPVDVTNPANAAYYLRSYHAHCWWYKK